MTIFALLLQACGLSRREAAEYLGVRPDTVKSWAAGRRGAPDGAMDQLAKLFVGCDAFANTFVERAAERAVDVPLPDLSDQPGGRATMALIVAQGVRRGYRFRIVEDDHA